VAIRTIRKWNDSILHKKSRDVTAFDHRLHQLLDDMADTMREANGVGLAAVQVGVLRRVITIDVGDGMIELINPVITEMSEETIDAAEGCLSFPGQQGMVERPKRVTVEAYDRFGEPFTVVGEDLLARAFYHEIDHTNGIVYLDRATEVFDEEDEEDGEEE
jgi:peptide deformylase